MARKRGGLAGVWDRNKGWMKSVVPAALGAIPGVGVPLAIGAGAAMRGLDRPGKRGIGLDVGQAVRGGLEGYGMGKLGQGARAGIGKMLAPKAAGAASSAGAAKPALFADFASPGGAANVPGIGAGMGGTPSMMIDPFQSITSPLPAVTGARPSTGMVNRMVSPSSGPVTSVSLGAMRAPAIGSLASQAAPSGGNLLTKTLDFATKYEKPLGMLVEGVAGGVPSAEVETARARNVLDERRFEEELRLQKLKEERQALLAELLMPILNSRLNERRAPTTNAMG